MWRRGPVLLAGVGVVGGGGACLARCRRRPSGRGGVNRCAGRVAAGGAVVGLEGAGEPEEGAEPRVPGQYAPSGLAGVADDLAGDLDEGLAECAELHGQQDSALLEVPVGPAAVDGQEEGAPRFDAPGEAGHGHVRRVGDQGC